MSQKVSFSHIDVGYPPWALEFDPYSRGYLLVAGGGGEGKLPTKYLASMVEF
jgi:hypothetical protein